MTQLPPTHIRSLPAALLVMWFLSENSMTPTFLGIVI